MQHLRCFTLHLCKGAVILTMPNGLASRPSNNTCDVLNGT